MDIILPWHFEPESTSISSIQIPPSSYLVPHQKEETIMNLDDIMLRLDIALSDRDWEAIRLLMEDIREELDLDSSPINDYGDDDWAVPNE
jgi:hypothetical protein